MEQAAATFLSVAGAIRSGSEPDRHRTRTKEHPEPMQEAASSLEHRLAPVEEIFFTWLMRVFAAATLVGCAWIDDAPPLDLAATIIGIYVAVRVVTQFGNLMSAAPFENRILKAACAVFAIVLLALSFMAIITFIEHVALSVAG